MVSFIVLTRKILGRRGVFLLRNVVSGFTYHTGLYEYADSTTRHTGISALMCTYNEEDWIEPSIMSIKDLVDEYVIVDSSNDRTPDIVRSVSEEHGLNIKIIRVSPGDLVQARLIALRNSSYKWLMSMDADMILYEKGIKIIRGLVEELNPRRHYLVYWKYLLLCGDLYHVCGKNPYHVEHWLFTYSSKLKYKYLDFGKGVYMEALIAPLTLYKPIYMDEVLGVHLTKVRSPAKLALKHLRLEHRKILLEYIKTGLDAEKALLKIARDVYGTENLEEIGTRLIKESVDRLPRYDESKYGPLPKVLLDYVKKKYPNFS
ncbi:MAG: glycosyltransferase [Desulfurococcaceae archaeon]